MQTPQQATATFRVPIQGSEEQRSGHPSGGSFQGYACVGDSVSDSTNQIETVSLFGDL